MIHPPGSPLNAFGFGLWLMADGFSHPDTSQADPSPAFGVSVFRLSAFRSDN
jgi:hypothetical protein